MRDDLIRAGVIGIGVGLGSLLRARINAWYARRHAGQVRVAPPVSLPANWLMFRLSAAGRKTYREGGPWRKKGTAAPWHICD